MAENTNQTNQPNEQKPKRRFWASGLSVLLIILIILVGVMTWLYIDQKVTTQEITTELQTEKDSLQSQLIKIRSDYDSLKTTSDTLNEKLNLEQNRVNNLLSELKTTKATNYRRMKELKDEVNTLRSIAKSYVRQIDSLNRANQKLMAENRRVKEEMSDAQENRNRLEKEKDTLSEKVQKASILRTEDLEAIPINERGNEKTKVNKIDKIKVCFTLEENAVAPPGERYLYMRISSPPDDYILTNSEDNLFKYQDEQMVYTARRSVEYEGESMDICIYFDSQGELSPGEYKVDIFADENRIGETTFQLEESGWLIF
ncbi:MAG: coiled-coil domain-containing protein [Bacteroidota bacterium]